MLFQGLSVGAWNGLGDGSPDYCWKGHPFNSGNNINSVDGDPDANGNGFRIQNCTTSSCSSDPVLARQQALVGHFLDTLAAYPNVIWEIGNETNDGASHSQAVTWQYYWIQWIKDYERTHGYMRHPVWMTQVYAPGDIADLTASNADAISTVNDDSLSNIYSTDPPLFATRVVISDSDHYGMDDVSPAIMFRQAMRGYNLAIMDCAPDLCDTGGPDEATRYAAGDARGYLNLLNLANAVPWDNTTTGIGKCGTTYCLGNDTDHQYLSFYSTGSTLGAKNLTTAAGTTVCVWVNLTTAATAACTFPGTGAQNYTAPATGPHLLYVH